jgi:hypothetical protein
MQGSTRGAEEAAFWQRRGRQYECDQRVREVAEVQRRQGLQLAIQRAEGGEQPGRAEGEGVTQGPTPGRSSLAKHIQKGRNGSGGDSGIPACCIPMLLLLRSRLAPGPTRRGLLKPCLAS